MMSLGGGGGGGSVGGHSHGHPASPIGTFPTLEDVFNARNLDTPRIHVKVKLLVLDVVKKDTI